MPIFPIHKLCSFDGPVHLHVVHGWARTHLANGRALLNVLVVVVVVVSCVPRARHTSRDINKPFPTFQPKIETDSNVKHKNDPFLLPEENVNSLTELFNK